MSSITVKPKKLQGRLTLPPDKSISHRAVIIGALAKGKTLIKNLSLCEDCLSTIDAFRRMGIGITKDKALFCVQGKGLNGLKHPETGLYLGNSGTSMRLILGVLAGQDFTCVLSGDDSLSARPMKRVTLPLSLMGAKIKGSGRGRQFAPLTIHGGKLSPISYESPVASAQVKSAILLAGLYAPGITVVREPAKSRDHTERMLKKFGAGIVTRGSRVSVKGRADLTGRKIDVPGDISSANFFLVGACISPGSSVTAKDVGLNSTRTASLKVLQRMGAALKWKYRTRGMAKDDYEGEARGDVTARYSRLKGITIRPGEVPSLIDELPVLMVAATQAKGTTVIQGAGELRVKETDRIKAMVSNLTKMGAKIKSSGDTVTVRGPSRLRGATVESFNDHRIAMSMAVAGLVACGPTIIKNIGCVNISFPGFFDMLDKVT